MTDTHKKAMDDCQACHILCQETLAYHGDKTGGRQLSSQHIKRLMACIEMCRTTAGLLAIRAPLVEQTCEICAHICEQCATSCAAIDNEAMQKCADQCRRCARSCFDESSHIKKMAA